MPESLTPKGLLTGLGFAIVVISATAVADDWHGRHDHGDRRGIYFDEHYHHRHYYPAIGFSVPLLPADSIALAFNGGRLFFNAGVWYRPVGSGFVVIRPPVGISVPVLPPGYSTIWVGSSPYYYANDTYYASTPNGYVVATPPAGSISETAPQGYISAPPQTSAQSMPPPPAPGTQPTPAPAPGNWYYCESSKTYYPYVSECPEGWRQVPANPSPTGR